MYQIFSLILLVITLAFTTQSRCTEADKIQCGSNEKVVEDGCVCEKGYIRSYTGNCDQCDEGYLQKTDAEGNLQCVIATGDPRNLKKTFMKNDQEMVSQMTSTFDERKNNEMFREAFAFENDKRNCFPVRSAAQFETEGNEIPGVYPAYNSYKQAEFISTDEFEEGARQAEKNFNRIDRFLNKTKIKSGTGSLGIQNRMSNIQYSSLYDGGGILSLPFDIKSQAVPLAKIDTGNFKSTELEENPGPYPSVHYKKTEQFPKNIMEIPQKSKNKMIDRTTEAELPEPQYLEKTGIPVGNVAADYAMTGMGIRFNNPENQLTSYAQGDIMTGYKPLNEIVRPIGIPVLTNRISEREITYNPTPSSEVLAPPIPIDELNKKKKQGENLGRIPYGTTGSYVADRPRGELPEINVGDTLKVWQAANPFYDITGKYNSRRETIFRNKREIHIPDTMGQGYFGDHLNPLKNITNSDKFFFAGEKDGMRNVTNRDDRHNDRVLSEPRAAFADIDENLIRSVPDRSTSNKTNADHESKFYQYNNSYSVVNQPVRGAEITLDTMRYEFPSYSKPTLGMIPYYSSTENGRNVAAGLPSLGH